MEEHTNSCQKNFAVQGIKSQDLFQDFKTGYLRKLNNTRNIHYISIKFASLRNRKDAFLCYYLDIKEAVCILINLKIKSRLCN